MIECCRNCKAPKRHARCHISCQEYIEEKYKLEQSNRAHAKEKEIERGLYEQKANRSLRIQKKEELDKEAFV